MSHRRRIIHFIPVFSLHNRCTLHVPFPQCFPGTKVVRWFSSAGELPLPHALLFFSSPNHWFFPPWSPNLTPHPPLFLVCPPFFSKLDRNAFTVLLFSKFVIHSPPPSDAPVLPPAPVEPPIGPCGQACVDLETRPLRTCCFPRAFSFHESSPVPITFFSRRGTLVLLTDYASYSSLCSLRD